MAEKVQGILEKAGLNGSEAMMLQNLLEAAESVPLQKVIAACGMTEFTGYRTARRLMERGLVLLDL